MFLKESRSMQLNIQEFNARQNTIKARDTFTRDTTSDGSTIDFVLIPDGKTINESKSMDDYDDELHHDFVLTYEKFLDNNMQIEGLNLHEPEELVLASSYCNILFNYPCRRQSTVFSIRADSDITGFTRKELALKAMRLYHLKVYLCKNYDITKGCIVSDELAKERKIVIFEPAMYMGEWERNGLVSLTYQKNVDQWVFDCYEYL